MLWTLFQSSNTLHLWCPHLVQWIWLQTWKISCWSSNFICLTWWLGVKWINRMSSALVSQAKNILSLFRRALNVYLSMKKWHMLIFMRQLAKSKIVKHCRIFSKRWCFSSNNSRWLNLQWCNSNNSSKSKWEWHRCQTWPMLKLPRWWISNSRCNNNNQLNNSKC